MEGTFSLNDSQFTVGEISDRKGNRFKGIGIISPGRLSDYPLIITTEQAQGLVECLDKALRQEFPAKTEFSFGRWNLMTWKFELNKYDEKWFHGGGFKGSFAFIALLGYQWFPIEMSRQAVTEFRDCLTRFYGLKPTAHP